MNPPDEVNTPDSELDKNMRELIRILDPPHERWLSNSANDNKIREIYRDLLRWRKESLLALIGEDDEMIKYSGNSRFDQQVYFEILGANKLRAELRKSIEE